MNKPQYRAIGLLVRKDQILLGQKGDGIGVGNYIAIGGKPKGNETLEQTLIREMKEEIGIEVLDYNLVAKITFLFQQKKEWNQTVYVFTCSKWKGIITPSIEITPKWFWTNEIPYQYMWADAKIWYPYIISGQKIHADFLYNPDNKTLARHNVTIVSEV